MYENKSRYVRVRERKRDIECHLSRLAWREGESSIALWERERSSIAL